MMRLKCKADGKAGNIKQPSQDTKKSIRAAPL